MANLVDQSIKIYLIPTNNLITFGKIFAPSPRTTLKKSFFQIRKCVSRACSREINLPLCCQMSISSYWCYEDGSERRLQFPWWQCRTYQSPQLAGLSKPKCSFCATGTDFEPQCTFSLAML